MKTMKMTEYETFFYTDGIEGSVAFYWHVPKSRTYRVYAPIGATVPTVFKSKRDAVAYIEKTVATDALLARHGSIYTRPLETVVGRG